MFLLPVNKVSRLLLNVLIYISYISNKRIFVQCTFVFEEKKPTRKPLNRWLKKQPRWFSMQAYACVWDWKPTFHGPNVRSHKKHSI